MDVIYQGVTWRRRITINDTATPPNPVDPSPIAAALCPETPITVTYVSPGVYDVTLSAAQTSALTASQTHWELMGDVDGDRLMLTRQQVMIQSTCVSFDPVVSQP